MPTTLDRAFAGTALAIHPTVERINSASDGWPTLVDMKVIQPGMVHYDDLMNSDGTMASGNVLVQKEALDRMAASMEGRPIINWDHRSVDPKDFSKGRAQGIVTSKAEFDPSDGWYHAKGLIWDPATLKNIKDGFSISCAYRVNSWAPGGVHNQMPYAAEMTDGEYTHIAVVEIPRYTGARIELLNSVQGDTMGMLSFFKKDKPEEKVEFDPATAVVAVGEKEVALTELINSFKSVEAAKASAPTKVGMDDLIEVDGKKVAVKELLNAHVAVLKNAMESDHKEGKHDDAEKENCGMCNSADDDKKAKEEEDRKNAADAEEKKKADDERKNAVDKAARVKAEKEAADAAGKKFDELRNKGKEIKMPEIKTVQSLAAEGQSRYGSSKPAVVSVQ